jgi:hypothetical protein
MWTRSAEPSHLNDFVRPRVSGTWSQNAHLENAHHGTTPPFSEFQSRLFYPACMTVNPGAASTSGSTGLFADAVGAHSTTCVARSMIVAGRGAALVPAATTKWWDAGDLVPDVVFYAAVYVSRVDAFTPRSCSVRSVIIRRYRLGTPSFSTPPTSPDHRLTITTHAHCHTGPSSQHGTAGRRGTKARIPLSAVPPLPS